MLEIPKNYLRLIALSSLLAGFSLLAIVFFTNPYQSSRLTFVFFYISLFLTSLGAFTLVGVGLRQWISREVYILSLSASFRQAILISLLLVISFLLLALGLWHWWVEFSLILFFLFVEIFFTLKV